MPVIEERYDQNKIDSLKRYLKREADKGRSRDYEIMVDGFKVVSRTNEVDEFDDYEEEIKDNTRNIAILIYDGAGTNRNTRYSFSLNQDNSSPIPTKPVNGMGSLGEIDEIIQQRLDEKEKDFKISTLEKELEETSQKLSEAEDYHKQLEAEIVRIREEKPKPHPLSLPIGEIGAMVLDGLFKRNMPKLAGILNGISEQVQPTQTGTEPDVEATFQKKANGQTFPQLTVEQQNRLRNLELMEQAFNGEQLQVVIAIIQKLIQKPEQVIPVAQFLNLQNENEHA
jgi:hypothetical protein